MTRAYSLPTGVSGSPWLSNTALGLTAAGSTQGTALAIPSGQDASIFTTTGSGTGAILPSAGLTRGEEYVVANHGANALLIYPATGGTIGNASVNAGYSLASGKTGYFIYIGNQQWTANP